MIGLRVPIVLAPMAGGPSTPALAAAVSKAGGLGMLAAGYRTAEDLRGDLLAVRSLTDAAVGVNLFAPPATAPADGAAIAAYAARITGEAERHGAALGAPRRDDDGWDAKLAVVQELGPAVVSFTFGCPPPELVARLRARGSEVWVTVTEAAEARIAADAGATALVVQGVEAGGHRASFADEDDAGTTGLLALLALVRAAVDLPLVAAGGIADGRGVAAVLGAGAAAAQLGTAFMRTPEAGTTPEHRAALVRPTPTRMTRAFTGRRARGLVNRFLREHDAHAPAAYPEVHHLTAPLRAAARQAHDPESVNLWAGQAHALAREVPAAQLVAELQAEAREALATAARRLEGRDAGRHDAMASGPRPRPRSTP